MKVIQPFRHLAVMAHSWSGLDGVSVLGGLEIERVDGHHLDRRCLRLRRYEDHGRDTAVDRKRQPFNQFIVGHNAVISGRQDAVDTLQPKGLVEGYGLAQRARHYDTAGRRTSGYATLS